jgi:hypothetical protein
MLARSVVQSSAVSTGPKHTRNERRKEGGKTHERRPKRK